MKKVLLLLLLTISLSLTACGNKDQEKDNNLPREENEVEDKQADDEDVEDEEETDMSDKTLGESIQDSFHTIMADGEGDLDTLSIAKKLLENENLLFDGDAMKIEEGLLPGFGNYEVKGFEEGAAFGPMITSIAFVGYVFKLPQDADVETFMTQLKDMADPRWNVCVEADETIVDAKGNTVFFLMCPSKFEE